MTSSLSDYGCSLRAQLGGHSKQQHCIWNCSAILQTYRIRYALLLQFVFRNKEAQDWNIISRINVPNKPQIHWIHNRKEAMIWKPRRTIPSTIHTVTAIHISLWNCVPRSVPLPRSMFSAKPRWSSASAKCTKEQIKNTVNMWFQLDQIFRFFYLT